MPEQNRQSVGKSAAHVYIEITLGTFVGFLLWLILSRITTPDVIGTSSTVLSLAAVFTTIVSLGIPNSAARFLGKSVGEQKFSEAKGFVKVSLLLTSLGVVAGSLAIIMVKDIWVLDDLSFNLVVLTIVLMGSFAFDYLLRYVLISFSNQKYWLYDR